jgi:DNA-damage-inducible protein D
MESNNALSVFEDKKIRKTWFNEEWWFVLEDIVVALTNSNDVKQYINRMRQRDEELSKGWVQIVHTLPIETSGGKQKMNCVNTEKAFRIIQSIPSPKAEPFKLWLAKVGYERVQEINDPELAGKRMKEIYKAKGYSDEWIEKRVRGINVRNELTDEWSKRGVREGLEYGILTDEISKATFGKTTKQYKKFKSLSKQNLRDHMDDLELIFSMLGEASTTRIAQSKDARGFVENKVAAKDGGEVAGNARKELERKSGKKVSTKENYLDEPESKKRKKLK